MPKPQKNVLGTNLVVCGTDPITGYFRDGCCNTGDGDVGTHTVCAIVDDRFLEFSMSKGNDLVTPRPEYGFEGLKSGDCWRVELQGFSWCGDWGMRKIRSFL